MNDEMIKELWEAIDDSATARKLEAKINRLLIEARIEELENTFKLLDKEFSYYSGGESYSKATGTVGHPARTKKVIDERIAELKKQLGEK